jgi:hypothetical protein
MPGLASGHCPDNGTLVAMEDPAVTHLDAIV